ncbi:hypothetical protein ZWY2020_054999 [Hordeum vulgare]|nr:hypothetical protein ZWY2020_054999 [Hordeum vulgare]
MGGLSGKVSFEHWAWFRAQTRPFIYVWAITIDPQQRPLLLLLPPFTGPPPDSNSAAVAAAAEPWALRASRFPLTAAAASIHPSIPTTKPPPTPPHPR